MRESYLRVYASHYVYVGDTSFVLTAVLSDRRNVSFFTGMCVTYVFFGDTSFCLLSVYLPFSVFYVFAGNTRLTE